MHIIIAILTALAGVFWVVHRLNSEGFDFDSLNPFLWMRRAHWKKQLHTDPLHALSHPIEVASVLMLATAKATGEISKEEKDNIKQLMVSELCCSENQATELFQASSYLLRDKISVAKEAHLILAPVKDQFNRDQVNSLLGLMRKIANIDSANTEQQTLIKTVQMQFEAGEKLGDW